MRPAVTAFATPAKHRVKLAQPSAGPEPRHSVAVRVTVYKQWCPTFRAASTPNTIDEVMHMALDAIDRHARRSGETRSGLLARAAIRYIGRDGDGLPTAQPGGVRARRVRKASGGGAGASAARRSRRR